MYLNLNNTILLSTSEEPQKAVCLSSPPLPFAVLHPSLEGLVSFRMGIQVSLLRHCVRDKEM